MNFRKLFIEHPQSVDETYSEHFQMAAFFAWNLMKAAGAACVHALVPGLFEKTASNIISMLHDRMVVNRRKNLQPAANAAKATNSSSAPAEV